MSNYDIPDSNKSYNNTSNSSRNYVFTNYDYTHTSHKHFYNTHFVLNINDDNRCTLKRIKSYIKKETPINTLLSLYKMQGGSWDVSDIEDIKIKKIIFLSKSKYFSALSDIFIIICFCILSIFLCIYNIMCIVFICFALLNLILDYIICRKKVIVFQLKDKREYYLPTDNINEEFDFLVQEIGRRINPLTDENAENINTIKCPVCKSIWCYSDVLSYEDIKNQICPRCGHTFS